MIDAGHGQAGDTNLGYQTFLDGTLEHRARHELVAADTIDHGTTENDRLTATSTRTVLIESATRYLLSRSATEENPFLATTLACGRAHCGQPGAPMRKCNTSNNIFR